MDDESRGEGILLRLGEIPQSFEIGACSRVVPAVEATADMAHAGCWDRRDEPAFDCLIQTIPGIFGRPARVAWQVSAGNYS